MKFSIIVVALNPGEKLEKTLNSIFSQTCTDYEIILKDGGSRDGSMEAWRASERVEFFCEPDKGIYDAMNQAAEAARGRYVYFLNCGDFFAERDVLSKIHSLMLENRQNGRITGVKDIKSFDEKEILLFTQAGKLVIKGEQLHVKQLDLEKGEVDLEGRVDSLTYLSKNTDNRDESLFKRMFR